MLGDRIYIIKALLKIQSYLDEEKYKIIYIIENGELSFDLCSSDSQE
jgi:hypothetical protein